MRSVFRRLGPAVRGGKKGVAERQQKKEEAVIVSFIFGRNNHVLHCRSGNPMKGMTFEGGEQRQTFSLDNDGSLFRSTMNVKIRRRASRSHIVNNAPSFLFFFIIASCLFLFRHSASLPTPHQVGTSLVHATPQHGHSEGAEME